MIFFFFTSRWDKDFLIFVLILYPYTNLSESFCLHAVEQIYKEFRKINGSFVKNAKSFCQDIHVFFPDYQVKVKVSKEFV